MLLDACEPYVSKLGRLIQRSGMSHSLSSSVALGDSERVFRAASAEEAYALALAHGKGHNHEYANSKNEVVRWRFEGLSDLVETSASRIRTGTEIYSRLSQNRRARSFNPRRSGDGISL